MSEQIAPPSFADALGNWTTRDGPVYTRLAEAIADAIAQGHVGLGVRLPSARVLAGHLRVARGTVPLLSSVVFLALMRRTGLRSERTAGEGGAG